MKKPTSCEQRTQIERVGSPSSDYCCAMPMPPSPLHEFIAIDGSAYFFTVIYSSHIHLPYSFPPPFFYFLFPVFFNLFCLWVFFNLGPVMSDGDWVMVRRPGMKDLWELSLVKDEASRPLEVRFGGPAKHYWTNALPNTTGLMLSPLEMADSMLSSLEGEGVQIKQWRNP
ncbi:hypothetical protein LOK49_LG01G00989 [Camellia lanceoleosa]|uniref:Uncharacterized protein n=1 Tax=Camellia lanceoleosa TaxID=1840588 RepID=A0ACC0IYB6_9ERIC|nr:hypothetical protein LOK49_LG01G00989 [Camellia lanceoleosa]